MMLAAVFFVVAAWMGWQRARRRGGTRADQVQFALAHGVPAALFGLLISIVLLRMGA